MPTKTTKPTVHEDAYEPPPTRINHRQFREIKTAVLEKEDNNYDHLCFFPCIGEDGWRMAGGHSALLYAYQVMKPLNKEFHITPDEPAFKPLSSTGVIRIHGTSTVRQRLKTLGLYEGEYHHQGLVIFYLTRTFTQHNLDAIWEEEQRRRRKINSIVELETPDPELATLINNASKRLYNICAYKWGKFGGQTFGTEVVSLLKTLALTQHALTTTSDEQQLQQGWDKMQKLTQRIIALLQIVGAWGIWPREKCASVALDFVVIKRHLEENSPKCPSKN